MNWRGAIASFFLMAPALAIAGWFFWNMWTNKEAPIRLYKPPGEGR
jgi:hypothetical protein